MGSARAILVPGVDESLAADIEARIAEFERDHEATVAAGGPGWVPRIRPSDYAVAIAVNLVITIWLIVALVGG